MPPPFGQGVSFTPLLNLQTPRTSQAAAPASQGSPRVTSSPTHCGRPRWEGGGRTPACLFPKAQPLHDSKSLGVAVPPPQTPDHAQDLHHAWLNDMFEGLSHTKSHIPGPKLKDLSHWSFHVSAAAAVGPAHRPGAGPLLTVVRRHRVQWRNGDPATKSRRTTANRHPWATKPFLTHDAFGSRSSNRGITLILSVPFFLVVYC